MSAMPDRKQDLDAYARPRFWRSIGDLATSVVPYLGLTVLMYLTMGDSIWLTLALAVPTAGFLLRTFIIFHDCVMARISARAASTTSSAASPVR
jgi:omega-6 fatty acid desaturase (delta-12 desaturase)